MSELIRDKFVNGVAVDPDSGCWVWARAKTKAGYGKICFLGTSHYTHRVSWELHMGPIPDGMHALHKCDNPPCCNPSHLFLGTPRDNSLDMVAKGRGGRPFGGPWVPGEKHGNAKLTDDIVRAIRANSEPIAVAAKRFGVCASTISVIRNRKSWAHVA